MPYFDHNATAPLTARAREAWRQAQEAHWHNPSSLYRDAAKAKIRLDYAREQIAAVLGCAAQRIVFNSGATEGNNAVLAHAARTLRADQKIAVNPTEHPCVLAAAEHFFPAERIVRLELDSCGAVRLDRLEARLAPGGIGLVSVMAANNETGVIQPWRAIAALSRRFHAAYHCDASQWLGKLPASGLGECDWVTGTAHKFGGAKGSGLLMIAAAAGAFRAQRGGEQEGGHRAGTEDYPAVAALCTALLEAETTKVFLETERLRWRAQFEQAARAALPGLRVVGGEADRLWNTVSLLMPHGENHRWVTKLDKRGFQVSTGSACASGAKAPSHVLAALGLAPEEAKRVIRISSGWETAEADWQALRAALAAVAPELAASPAAVVQP